MSLMNWLYRSVPSLQKPLRQGRPLSFRCRPRLETLEDRLAPAAHISIIATGVGNLDHFLTATQGTITTADDPGDLKATLSEAALQSVGAEVPINIAATSSIAFTGLSLGMLKLQTDIGLDATFTTNTGPIIFSVLTNTVSTSGGSLHFNAGTGLTVGNLNTNGGDVSLTAGLGGAGNLTFTNIRTGGSGNLSFQATNAAGGSITQVGSATASGLAISAAATGNIVVNALRGTTVDLISNKGSISSAGAAAVQATRQLSLSAATGITVNTLAATLSASNSASGNISITQAASPRQALVIAGSGGGIVNSASGGQIQLTNLGSGIAVENGVGVQTNNGSLILAAADFSLSGPVDSRSASTTLANSVFGRQISLGTKVAGEIGLTQAALNNVTAGVLRIGTNTSGTINISGPIKNPATWNTLALISGNGITESPAGSLTLPNLRVSSGGSVTLTSANNVAVLAAATANAFTFNNGTHLLTVGIVDGNVGITNNQSRVVLIADNLNITQPISTGSSTPPAW